MNSVAIERASAHRVSSEEFELILQEMVRLIVAEVDPEQIILFGSRARGDERPDSDVDLMIVYDGEKSQKSSMKIVTDLYFELRNTELEFDLIAYSSEEFENLRTSPNLVAGRAFREGLVVYARP